MIATRFKYDYTLKDAFIAFCNLFRKREISIQSLKDKFPSSEIYHTSYARLGIKYILKSFNLKDGAKIGVQPYTCSSVLSAITAAGYYPFFIDINDQLSIDTNDLSKKISQIDALIVTHIFGFPADIEKIKQITGSLPVMEDCAHALFSQYNKQPLGTFFDAAAFSFGSGKFPSLGSGGFVTVNNKACTAYISDHLKQLPSPGILKEIKNIAGSYAAYLMHTKAGYSLTKLLFSKKYFANRNKEILPYPESELKIFKTVKYLLRYKLPLYNERSQTQNKNGEYLTWNLSKNFHLLKSGSNFVNYFAFPIITNKRDEIFDYLNSKGIICGKHFQHALDWAVQYKYEKGSCPVFEKYAGSILTIPSNYSLEKKDLDVIIASLNEIGPKSKLKDYKQNS